MSPNIDRRDVMKAIGLAGLAGLVGSSTTGEVAAADRRGPVRKSRFTVQIADIQVPGWVRAELPDARINRAEYRNGNEADENRQLWGRADHENLVLSRGVEPTSAGNAQVPGQGQPVGTKLFDWFKKIKKGDVSDARKKVSVIVYNEAGPQGHPVAKWVFEKAWPIEYSPPTLDATAQGEVAMESLTLAFYDFARKSP